MLSKLALSARAGFKPTFKTLIPTSQVNKTKTKAYSLISCVIFFKITRKVLTSKCNISLQEYQSKKLLEANGVNIQRFQMATTPQEAYEAGTNLSM
jgi:hypothetical protein